MSVRVHPDYTHEVFMAKIHSAERITGYEFKNKMILTHALTVGHGTFWMHPILNTNWPSDTPTRERLAGLGDVQFKLHIRLRFPSFHRGTMSYKLQAIESNANFASICENSGLSECTMTSPHGPSRPKTKADTFEAVLGAVFEDAAGYDGELSCHSGTVADYNSAMAAVAKVIERLVDVEGLQQIP